MEVSGGRCGVKKQKEKMQKTGWGLKGHVMETDFSLTATGVHTKGF